MRKRMMQVLELLLLSGLLTGCSMLNDNHGLSEKDPVEISIWNYYNGGQAVAFDKLVSEFNSTVGEKEGIIVSSESKGSIDELVTALNDSLNQKVGAAKELPNMFASYLDTAVTFDKAEVLVNLDEYVSEEDKSSYVDNYIEEGSFGKDDNWMLYPIVKSTEVMILNKTDWEPFAEENGFTADDLSTWESLTEVAESYYEYSDGKSFFGRDAFANYMILGSMQLGQEIFEVSQGKVKLNFEEDVARKLWDNFYIPYVKGYYKQVGRYRSDDIKLGEIMSMVCSSSSAAYFPTEVTSKEKGTYNIDYLILPVPNFEGTEKYAVQQGASVAVTKCNEKEEYASVVFLQWLTETEQNIKFAVESGYLPVKKEANTPEMFNDYFQKKNLKIEGIEKDAIEVSLKQIQESTMYTSKGFEEGYAAREILNSTMPDQMVEDKAQIDGKIAAGTGKEEAEEGYLLEEHFKEWYQSTKNELESSCQQ